MSHSLGLSGSSTHEALEAVVEAALAEAMEHLDAVEARFDASPCNDDRFERIVESLAMSVWITRQGRILYANPAAAELLSVERARLVGVDLSQFAVEEDAGKLAADLLRFEGGATAPLDEYRLMSRDGRPLTVELGSVALIYEQSIAVLSFGRDVSSRKQAEQSLLKSDRLNALGLLAGGMAHALSNPLTYVMLNLDQVTEQLRELEGGRGRAGDAMTRLSEAREGAERMANVVRRIRGMARPEESLWRLLDLKTVLESVIELVGHELHHRGKFSTRLGDGICVYANESKLEHICLGLLLVASQLVPDEPKARHDVRLTLEVDERQFAVLEIVCDGCRSDAHEVARFQEVYENHETDEVQGFGLSVCRALVDELGGQIAVESLPGTGLVLRTTIPCAEPVRLSEKPKPCAPSPRSMIVTAGKARVLLIDDDPGVVHALRALLEAEHDVRSLLEPRQALEELLRDPNYDLIFCDLMMPGLSGMDLFRVLRFNRPGYESRIVFITGGATTPESRRFLEQVANPRLEKPFNWRALSELLAHAAQRRALLA